jgi:folate-binding protein YgfZ
MDLNFTPETLNGTASAPPTAWLRVTGPDSADFLQGQCTQELRRLLPGQTTPALWLNPKGRILGESIILKVALDSWWLWSPHTPGQTLRTRLEDFIIADDVTVESTAWEQVTITGPAASAWLQSALGGTPAPAPGQWLALGDGLLFAGRRAQPDIWDWLRPANSSLPLPPPTLGDLSSAALLRTRLAAGVPAIPAEFGPADLPQEAGLETVAISFTKGCYLGQEVMARLHAMGQVRRRLVRVSGRGPAPSPGTEIRQAAKRIGELRATAHLDDTRWIGLALLNLLGLDPSAPLTTADGADLAITQP